MHYARFAHGRSHTCMLLQVSKWVGDIFNEGLYDIHIEVKKTPLLGWDSPDHMEKWVFCLSVLLR